MRREQEIRQSRLKKINTFRSAGINPYPSRSKRTHTVEEALSSFKKLTKEESVISLTGRVMMIREHGKLTFLNLKDASGIIQCLIGEDFVGKKSYSFFLHNFDIGDFIEVQGTLFITKRGENTLKIDNYKMLTKSVRPLPEKWHGIKDEEERLRRRYLDILFNPEVEDMVRKRSLFWNSIREFLVTRGFLEVETPVLETTAGGADARPFETHHQALDIDVYLRISMGELWQKKLMVAGLEKTFEIGRQFRNEGMSAEHLQDYTQMEFYWAYADYKQGMKLVEEMYRFIVKKTFNKTKFNIRGFDIDFAKKWERYDFRDTILKETNVDIEEQNLTGILKVLDKRGIKYDKEGMSKGRAVDLLWKQCRKKIAGPGFLINVPIDVSPLAKRNEKHPSIAERFQVIVAGSEVGNGYSELNDPIDQAERFAEQQRLRDSGDDEAQMFNDPFVEALEYGMPPTCGFGISERFFSFLMDRPARECQIFPLMKPKEK